MILVADSGSTKTDWILIGTDFGQQLFQTKGINPFFHGYKEITDIIQNSQELMKSAHLVKNIYFFGSGCSSPERIHQVTAPLQFLFPNAVVAVEHDMLGCALSVCEGKPGIACIMGTGSNTCLFDGKDLAPVRHGLGYILGDEGSGTYFGKKLVTAYIYHLLPEDLYASFEKKYQLTKEDILQQVYKGPSPNVWLASFALFLSEHARHAYIQQMVEDGIAYFFDTNILSYTESTTLPVHFTGSIAHVYEQEIRKEGARRRIQIGNVIQRPVQGLADFFASGGTMP